MSPSLALRAGMRTNGVLELIHEDSTLDTTVKNSRPAANPSSDAAPLENLLLRIVDAPIKRGVF